MRIIERLHQYLQQRNIAPYTFERSCGIANGYLKKQLKGKGSVGSDIIEKISMIYKDLSLNWLITGKGKMILDGEYETGIRSSNWSEDQPVYSSPDQVIQHLREKIDILERALADKDKIIRLLERSVEEVRGK